MSHPTGFSVIAIDGGAATGKSSTARGVADRLGFLHVDTGAHYRAMTAALLKMGVQPLENTALAEALEQIKLETAVDGLHAKLIINGKTPKGTDLRLPEVNAAVSAFAALAPVRSSLFAYQRSQTAVARHHKLPGLVMEGRDIGSVIFPDANFTFFLFADESTRIARRAQEGQTDQISERDKMDSGRKTAPLICPDHAERIDTGALDLAAVINHICERVAHAAP